MKRKSILRRIPRPVRAIINLVLAVALAVLYYISIGCPALSFQQEFRRAERAHLIGRSKIVDTVTDYRDYDKMIVGETEHGVCFFGVYDVTYGYSNGKNQTKPYYTFTYYEKTKDVTVAVAPNSSLIWGMAGASLPIYIFDTHPEAVRAEIRTTVSGEGTYFTIDGKKVTGPFTETFTAEAGRSGDGYFRFTLTDDDGKGSLALGLLSRVASGEQLVSDERDTIIPFTVRLYDASGDLIMEKELTISASQSRR